MGAKSSIDANAKRRRGRWKRILLWLLGVLVLLLVVVWFSLSALATWVANKKLPQLLNADASVGHILVYPARGMASIHNLRIGQPDGFGDDAFVELGRVMAHVDLKSLTDGEGIIVRAVEIEDLKAHVVKDDGGALNVLNLVPSSSEDIDTGDAADVGGVGSTAESPPDLEATEDPKPGIRFDQVAVSGVAIQYTDHTAGARPIDISLGNLAMQLRNGLIELSDMPEVTLDEGQVTLEDVRIAQPDDFGEDSLLELPRLHLEIGSVPFADHVVRLQGLEVNGLRAHIIRNAHGVINASRLGGGLPPPPPAPEETAAKQSEEAGHPEPAETAVVDGDDAEPSAPAATPVGVHLARLTLVDVGITYSDAMLAGDGSMEFVIRDLGLTVQDLMAFLAEPPAPTSAVDFSAALAQGDDPDARISLVAELGPIAGEVPDLNAQFKLTGLMLDVLGSLLPPGTRNALGAHGADLQLGLALNSTSIDLAGALKTDAGHSYDLMVHGPLDQPSVDLGPLMFAVAGRVVGGVANLATGSTGAALDVAKGATGGAKELGKGATGVIGDIGGGLFKSATGILKGDLKEVGEGVKGATAGTVKDAASAVGSAGNTVASQAKEGAQSATGSKRTSAWLAAGTSRHEADVATARKALEAMPFPPPEIVPPAGEDSGDDG